MIPVNNVRVARAAAIPGGHLIIHRSAQGNELGLSIVETEAGPRGVLWLRSGIPVFEQVDMDCLDLGEPIFAWIPGADDFFLSQGGRSQPGQLIVQGDSVLITGTEAGSEQRSPSAWNVGTGRRADPDMSLAAVLADWKLGVRSVNGVFEELVNSKEKRSFFG